MIALLVLIGGVILSLQGVNSLRIIEDEYLIVFNKTVDDDAVAAHMKNVQNQLKLLTKPTQDMKVLREWKIQRLFRAYAARFPKKMVERIGEMPEVAHVERNQEVRTLQGPQCLEQEYFVSGLWGLERSTVRDWDPEDRRDSYIYDSDRAGDGVDVYVLDTGISSHPDFGNRISEERSKNFVEDDDDNWKDGNGHGTGVTGTVLGETFGIAKKATGVAVRVLNDNGSETYQNVIEGVVYVANTAIPKKSIAVMALGGGLNLVLNDAVKAAIEMGVQFSIAAGGQNSDACNFSPASVEEGVTVAATDINDLASPFSNYGSCVDIYAPGLTVRTATLDGESAVFSGTSFASGYAAGVMAKLLSGTDEGMEPKDLKEELLTTATKDRIRNVPLGTPNLLVFDSCLPPDKM